MGFIKGIQYNIKGLATGLKTPKLLALGLTRFVAIILITSLAAGLVLVYHADIVNLIWHMPDSGWLVWLWHILSWTITLILLAVSALVAYLVAQLLFCVLIMDLMSRITEKMVLGRIVNPQNASIPAQLLFLIRQEIPRTLIPLVITLFVVIVGLLTPLGPIIAIVSSAFAAVFLAWDNTDLVPARRLVPFGERFLFLRKAVLFHLGFGLLFLIPLVNILFLSFAPVGATMYYIEKEMPGEL